MGERVSGGYRLSVSLYLTSERAGLAARAPSRSLTLRSATIRQIEANFQFRRVENRALVVKPLSKRTMPLSSSTF